MPAGAWVSTAAFTSTGGNTANVRTIYNPYTPAPGATTPGAAPSYNLGLSVPLGSLYIDYGGPDSVSGTTTQLPVGQVAVYKYVLYKSTTNPAVVALPGVVYYTDNTGLIVSGSPTDGIIGSVTAGAGMDTAGIMMVNSGDLTTLTATLLNNGTNGSAVWMCISGFVKALACLTGGAAGDQLYGNIQSSGTAFTVARIANGTAVSATSRPLGYAITSKATVNSANAQDAIITLTNFAGY